MRRRSITLAGNRHFCERLRVKHALANLTKHRARFARGGDDWWLTIPEATHLLGWHRTQTYRLIRSGLVTHRQVRTRSGRRLRRISGNDLLAYVRSRHDTQPHQTHRPRAA